ncbi:hypothetical protein [Prochlorococcus sp. MIT 1303]|nr:hypothetical protein [Prochlorococcus sp. MIT 1303]
MPRSHEWGFSAHAEAGNAKVPRHRLWPAALSLVEFKWPWDEGGKW